MYDFDLYLKLITQLALGNGGSIEPDFSVTESHFLTHVATFLHINYGLEKEKIFRGDYLEKGSFENDSKNMDKFGREWVKNYPKFSTCPKVAFNQSNPDHESFKLPEANFQEPEKAFLETDTHKTEPLAHWRWLEKLHKDGLLTDEPQGFFSDEKIVICFRHNDTYHMYNEETFSNKYLH